MSPALPPGRSWPGGPGRPTLPGLSRGAACLPSVEARERGGRIAPRAAGTRLVGLSSADRAKAREGPFLPFWSTPAALAALSDYCPRRGTDENKKCNHPAVL